MRLIVWLVRAAVFFTLFTFAVNNLEEATIHWFFDYQWRSRMVFIVLAAFGVGCAFGVFAMVPSWWRHRRLARTHMQRSTDRAAAPVATPAQDTGSGLQHPPRDGL
jgi:putative membrane protein